VTIRIKGCGGFRDRMAASGTLLPIRHVRFDGRYWG
jgi:hypothetical protein